MIKTVKDLKEYLNTLPDDALVYEQITQKGKHLEAVNPKLELETAADSDEDDIKPSYLVTHCYEFPDFVQVPLSTEPVLDVLNRYYKNIEENKFKKGDKVCYRSHPEVCIGTIADDDAIELMNGKSYMVYTSDEFLKVFHPAGGPNSIVVNENNIELFKEKL